MTKLPLPPRKRPIFAPASKAMTATEVKAKADAAAKPPKAKASVKATMAAADRADKGPRIVGPSAHNTSGKPAKVAGAKEAMQVFGVRLPATMANKLRKAADKRKVAPAVIVREALERVL